MVQQFELFQVALLISVRIMFLSKAFSMPGMVFHHILRLKYYTKNYRSVGLMTKMENVLVLTRFNTFVKKMERRFQKRRVLSNF